jgi:hypothetical protein
VRGIDSRVDIGSAASGDLRPDIAGEWVQALEPLTRPRLTVFTPNAHMESLHIILARNRSIELVFVQR